MIRVVIPGNPVAQPRQRHTKFGGNYVPKDHPVHAYKDAARLACRAEMARLGLPPLASALAVTLVFVTPRPKRIKAAGRTPRDTKPDVDNFLKSTFDAANEILWQDDSLVVRVTATKWYAAVDEQPHTALTVEMFRDESP